MSARFTAAGNLYRTSTVIDYGSAYTMMGWGQIVVDRNSTSTFFSVNRTASATDNYDCLTTATNGTTMQINVCVADGLSSSSGYALTVGKWYHFALVRESTTAIKFYVNGVQQGSTLTTNVAARSASDKLGLGNYFTGGGSALGGLNGRLSYVKCWQRALSASEISQEMKAALPISRLNFWGQWPLFAPDDGAGDRRDFSGNERHLTLSGTVGSSEESASLLYPATLNNQFSLPIFTLFTSSISGALTPSGALNKTLSIQQIVDGVLDFVGGLSSHHHALISQAIDGVLSFAGSLSRGAIAVSVVVAGVLSPVGGLGKTIYKFFSGAITAAAAMRRAAKLVTTTRLSGIFTSRTDLDGDI